MPKIQNTIQLPKKTKRIYSDFELNLFNEEMEYFRKPLIFTDLQGNEVNTTFIDPRDFYISKGAMVKKMYIGKEDYRVVVEYYDGKPALSLLDELEEKVQQWNSWKVKKEFIEKEKMNDLQNSANQLSDSIKNW